MKDWFEKNIEENEKELEQMETFILVAESGLYATPNGAKKKDRLYIGIFVQDNRHFEDDPYFKVSWQSDFRQDNKVARISMKNFDYVVHNKTSVEIPDEIIDKLNDVLPQKCEKNGMTNYSNWDAMLYQVSSKLGISLDECKKKFPLKKIDHLGKPDADRVTKWGKD